MQQEHENNQSERDRKELGHDPNLPSDDHELDAALENDENSQTDLVRSIKEAVLAENSEAVISQLEDVHSADLADVLELLDEGTRKSLTEIIRDDFDPELLAELEGQAFDDVISVLEPHEIADAVSNMDTDDAVVVLEDMDAVDRDLVLDQVSKDDRLIIEEALSYDQYSAGRLMQRDLIAVPLFWTIGQTIDYLRDNQDLPSDFWEIFVVDPHHHPVGTMPLSWVLRSRRNVKMADIMKTEQTLIPIDMDQEEIAYQFRQYNLVSAAVVDGQGRLVGMITVDDIVDVIEEEAEEDILAMAGVQEGDLNISIKEIAMTRFYWLFINLITAILASLVIAQFGESIEKLVALAVLMPIVASMGGNAGTQTMAVAVRALATKDLTPANAHRIVLKEVGAGLVNGVLLAIIMGVISAIWFENSSLGIVIGISMVINLIVAGLSGIVVPITLEKFNIDPAVSSSVFVTTITDVIGFLSFLGLAALYLL